MTWIRSPLSFLRAGSLIVMYDLVSRSDGFVEDIEGRPKRSLRNEIPFSLASAISCLMFVIEESLLFLDRGFGWLLLPLYFTSVGVVNTLLAGGYSTSFVVAASVSYNSIS